jgi:hypothetical protein
MTKKNTVPTGSTLKVNLEKYMTLLKIYHHIRYNKEVKKTDVIFKFGKDKNLVEDIWTCYHDQKIEWPVEIYQRVFGD